MHCSFVYVSAVFQVFSLSPTERFSSNTAMFLLTLPALKHLPQFEDNQDNKKIDHIYAFGMG